MALGRVLMYDNHFRVFSSKILRRIIPPFLIGKRQETKRSIFLSQSDGTTRDKEKHQNSSYFPMEMTKETKIGGKYSWDGRGCNILKDEGRNNAILREKGNLVNIEWNI